jgi:acetyl-CoA C-acetyltransferase
MRPVAITGLGKTPFGVFPDRDLRSLAAEAGRKCLENGHVPPSAVEAFYLGNFAGPSFTGQNHLAPYVGEALGLEGVPCTRFEAACASSGSAFFHAWSAVAAGVYDLVLVAGVEKMTSQPTPRVAEILASAGEVSGEMKAGATFPALFAMIARRHMHDFGTRREDLAAVAVKNHANGAKNPYAHMRKVITLEQALAGKSVAEPLTLYDCSLVSDGAAAVLLAPLERASEFTDKPVRIAGIAQTSDRVALDGKEDITTFPAVKRAGEKAYRMAGLGPREIQFAELHDCFTIAEIIALEDLGFTERGEGGRYTSAGCTLPTGARPVNASGGLKAKGHPVGATGVAQILDVALQIRGEAGAIELPRHEIGLAQNLGGSGATAVVTILMGPE